VESDKARPSLRVLYTSDSLFKQKQCVPSNKGNKVLRLSVRRNRDTQRYVTSATFPAGDTVSDWWNMQHAFCK